MFILPLLLNIVDSCSKSDAGRKITYDYESDYVSEIDGKKFDYDYEFDDGISETNLITNPGEKNCEGSAIFTLDHGKTLR